MIAPGAPGFAASANDSSLLNEMFPLNGNVVVAVSAGVSDEVCLRTMIVPLVGGGLT